MGRYKSPGVVVPSEDMSDETLVQNVRRLSEEAGFTSFNTDNFTDDAIQHYGVKGMHWGVRRDVKEIAGLARKSSSSKSDKTTSEFERQVRDAGGLHSVSDKDLQRMLNRLNMEQQYKSFIEKEKKRRLEGHKAALDLLLKVGRIAIPVLIGGVAAKTAGPTIFRTVSEYQKAIGR